MHYSSLTFTLVLLATTAAFAQQPRLVVPTGHSAGVLYTSFSADGKLFMTVGADNLIKFWNEEGQELRTLRPSEHEFRQAILSPDGKRILSAYCYSDNTAWILDAANGKTVFTLNGTEAALRSVNWSPSGKMVATATSYGDISLWNAENGQLIKRWNGSEATIEIIAFSPDENLIGVLSTDGVASVWDVRSGKKVFSQSTDGNFPISLQFSHDSKTISVISDFRTAEGITWWSLESGKKVATHDGNFCTFSEDGKYVCISKEGAGHIFNREDMSTPVRVLQPPYPPSDGPMMIPIVFCRFLSDSKQVLLSAGYYPVVYNFLTGQQTCAFKGYAEPVKGISISPDGKRFVIGSDNLIRPWNLEAAQPLKKMSGHSAAVNQAKFSPDGRLIVSVANDYTARVWAAQTGDTLFTIPMGLGLWPVQSYAGILALSPDGEYLVKGHGDDSDEKYPALSFWNLKDGSPRGNLRLDAAGYISLNDLAFSGDGQRLAVLDQGGIYMWNIKSGKWVWRKPAAQNEGFQSAIFHPDGHQLITGNTTGAVHFWETGSGQLVSKYQLDTVPIHPEEIYVTPSTSITKIVYSPDKKWIATTGQNKSILIWDAQTREPVKKLVGHENLVNGLDFTPDSRLLFSTSLDNTIRVWDMQKAEEIAKVIHLNGENWVVTTPSGLFDASPGAMEMMHFMAGDEVIELEQLKERYYEPGLLSKITGLAQGELRDVKQFKDIALFPEISAKIVQNQVKISLKPRNGGLGKLSLFINDKEAEEDINPGKKTELVVDLSAYNAFYSADTVNKIRLRAYNAEGWLKSQAYNLPYRYVRARGSGNGNANDAVHFEEKPRLFILTVGTADYSGEKLDLKYADQDALVMSVALKQAGEQLFGADVHSYVLTTGLVGDSTIKTEVSSKTTIQKHLKNLSKECRPSDILIVYFSGHGITYGEAEKAQFYYLTKDIASEDLSDPEVRQNFALSSDEMTELIKKNPARKQVLIIDACNSGKVVEALTAVDQKDLNPTQIRALERMKDRTGMFILTGSAADMVSYEASQYGQGLLTYSLLEGMSKRAYEADKNVDVMALFQHARDKVPELARSIQGIQTPVLAFPVNGASFDIGIVNDKVRIPLASVKPVFIRNNFQDEEAFEDVLGLGDALEQYFLRQMAKGAKSSLVYVDVKEFENAYSLKGRYTIRENVVEVRTRMFKGKTMVGEEFRVVGKKDDPGALVRQILEQVFKQL